MCNAVIWPSLWSYSDKWSGGLRERDPFTLLQDTLPSKWIWSCYFKVKKLHNLAITPETYISIDALSTCAMLALTISSMHHCAWREYNLSALLPWLSSYSLSSYSLHLTICSLICCHLLTCLPYGSLISLKVTASFDRPCLFISSQIFHLHLIFHLINFQLTRLTFLMSSYCLQQVSDM